MSKTPEEIAAKAADAFVMACGDVRGYFEDVVTHAIRARDAEAERDKAELVEALGIMLKSAVPHPVEHPTMTAAWQIGEKVFAKHGGERVVCPHCNGRGGRVSSVAEHLTCTRCGNSGSIPSQTGDSTK